MTIIQIKAQSNGAHANQTTSMPLPEIPEGWAVVPEDMAIPDTFPFVSIEVDGQVVISMSPSVVPDPEPVLEPIIVPSNELLSAQIKATTDRQDFLEDCIAEMASVIYS